MTPSKLLIQQLAAWNAIDKARIHPSMQLRTYTTLLASRTHGPEQRFNQQPLQQVRISQHHTNVAAHNSATTHFTQPSTPLSL